MNNGEIAALVAEQHSISKADAKAIVESVLAAVTDAAVRNEEVSINGFGQFRVKEAAAREGRNPTTGETIQIAASKRMGLVPAKALKDRLKRRASSSMSGGAEGETGFRHDRQGETAQKSATCPQADPSRRAGS